ncbi:hypothetical protein ACTXT7_011092 [Hymenolepis weldensis]
MKRHDVIVSIKAKNRKLEIARFLEVVRSFVCVVRKELNENSAGELATSKRKPHCQRSADSLRTPGLVRRVRGMIGENSEQSMRHLAIDVQMSEGTIRKKLQETHRLASMPNSLDFSPSGSYCQFPKKVLLNSFLTLFPLL